MEKSTPHCKLSKVKRLIEAGKVRSTGSALAGGAVLGLDFKGIVGVVMALVPSDFYKSMVTHADHRIWQDMYRPTTPFGEVYLKLTVIDDLLIVSFTKDRPLGRCWLNSTLPTVVSTILPSIITFIFACRSVSSS